MRSSQPTLSESSCLQAKRFICIHGHFYQPPRENPWLETVETQDTAAPYHDWNERICAECYAPNGAARVVNVKNQITRIVNNYARISFNFGPTLLSWLKENAPRTYRMMLDGEGRSRQRNRGHSSAMAQVYNHMILPLANARDRATQIRWGIADYENSFGAPPEGMWLPETAADTRDPGGPCRKRHPIHRAGSAPVQTDSPDQATEKGRRQATGSTRPTPRSTPRTHISSASLPAHPSPSSSTTVRSRAPSPLKGCSTPATISSRDSKRDSKTGTQPQLMHVATDGESYGHHHKYGEMALAYALRLLEQDKTVKLTNYAAFLEQFPPEFECEIVEDTSWSCVHGVERWRSNCGCNGGHPGWNQEWRAPLRQALDELRDALVPLTEKHGSKLFRDVWAARDAYIQVVLDRSTESADRFFAAHQAHPLSETSASAPSSSWRCSATRSSCTPAADGSSTTSAASRRCR